MIKYQQVRNYFCSIAADHLSSQPNYFLHHRHHCYKVRRNSCKDSTQLESKVFLNRALTYNYKTTSIRHWFCLLATIITIRLLILNMILCRGESLISIFHSFYKKPQFPSTTQFIQHFFYPKKKSSCCLRFISFLIWCSLRSIILFLRFLFYLAVLYLLSVFLASNIGSVFMVNVSFIIYDDFNNFFNFHF